MKIKPNHKSGGVLVELSRKEQILPTAFTNEAAEPLSVLKLKKILVPVDFSDCSRKALQYAIAFAKQFGAELTLLHVAQMYLPVAEMPAVDMGLIHRQILESATKELESLHRALASQVASRTVVRQGHPASEIVNVAKELEIDLIILATHGRTGLAHALLGSTAERAIRHAGCPVLVVREHEHEFITGNSMGKEAGQNANSNS